VLWHRLTLGIGPGWIDVVGLGATAVLVAAMALLMFGGIQLASRKPLSWLLHVAYAVGSLGSGIAILVVSICTAQAEDYTPSYLAGWYTGTVMSLIYPAFCLIWFLRPRIRDQIEAWRYEASVAGEVPRR
jgi:hypothetical protein